MDPPFQYHSHDGKDEREKNFGFDLGISVYNFSMDIAVLDNAVQTHNILPLFPAVLIGSLSVKASSKRWNIAVSKSASKYSGYRFYH